MTGSSFFMYSSAQFSSFSLSQSPFTHFSSRAPCLLDVSPVLKQADLEKVRLFLNISSTGLNLANVYRQGNVHSALTLGTIMMADDVAPSFMCYRIS